MGPKIGGLGVPFAFVLHVQALVDGGGGHSRIIVISAMDHKPLVRIT